MLKGDEMFSDGKFLILTLSKGMTIQDSKGIIWTSDTIVRVINESSISYHGVCNLQRVTENSAVLRVKSPYPIEHLVLKCLPVKLVIEKLDQNLKEMCMSEDQETTSLAYTLIMENYVHKK